jgi:FixJ family two-component response regulator
MNEPTVFVVDDDPGIRNSLTLLFDADQLKSACFATAKAFLAACGPSPDGCLILDVRMPGLSGHQLQDALIQQQIDLPVIFLTGFAEIAHAVDSLHKGALDYLEKPVNAAMLLQRVHSAMQMNLLGRQTAHMRSLLEAKLLTLTPREKAVLALALAGHVNKIIARDLHISLRTIEGYRAQIYLKMGVSSLLALVALAANVNLPIQALVLLLR